MTDRDPTLDDALGRAATAAHEVRRLQGRVDRLNAEVHRYLARFELVTLERDQLREEVAEGKAWQDRLVEALESAAEERAKLIEMGVISAEAIAELGERAGWPRPPRRAEVADFADEQDRLIAANADDRMTGDEPGWTPVLTGRISTAGGMGAVRVHDPDDPVARAFFTDEGATVIATGTPVADAVRRVRAEGDVAEASRLRRQRALEAQDLHDADVAAHAESEAAERSWHDEMADPPDPPDEV